ncbi:flagellar export chaperone FliS [Klenkia sp. PcliD-1-E]|jgi:flagellar secretion chaperone FliS|uniref:flagellar export chaperone FliS n=1 Tax=Klenkia sp. PcliD-1-E TaxID=2954492 RepID=UPI002096E575|nr:flagellar export chaperone FliS [Klenkia sp. PcliD-1-E]MCO7221998.1 flagellar export chaperone FliS [Klenkia sp. PcliD-1-E]
MTAALRSRYQSSAVETASPQRLLVMLYDRLALDLVRAEAALGEGDRVEASAQLMHAQDIVLELHSTLNPEVWEGAGALSSLYTWLYGEMVLANVKGDARRVADCRTVVEPLRDAWAEAAAILSGQSAG